MAKPVLLDLFCGAFGAGEGYARAGFDVYGIDNNPKVFRNARYPYLVMDALEAMERLLRGEGLMFSDGRTLYLEDIAAIHASPPCQRYTSLSVMWNAREHPDLVPPTRERLVALGLPYVY